MSSHGNEALCSQPSSAFSVQVAEPVEVQAAKPTGEHLAVCLHASQLQILNAVNNFTSGQLWLRLKMNEAGSD